jgi:serine/threonine protein kinase
MKSCPICDTAYPDQHNTCPSDGAVLIVTQELAAGSLVKNKYKIVSKLGQGGMGVVYLAEHILLGGHVALKFLVAELSRNPQFIKRFRNEAQAAFSLRHPNIVQVLDLDQTEDGSLFIAMEYVAGKSLRVVLDEERGGLSVPRALEMARGIISGLAAAHAQGTVHRDVKPDNVLLARAADGREQPKVLDFGIAAMAKSSTQPNMTRGRLLTPGYAAPEQWMEMPAAELDGRTDLYAMGCVFYEMLTGRTPFHAHNMEVCGRQHMEETPRLPSELRPELADWTGLDGLVMRLLAKNRNDRPQDAEVLSLLATVEYGPVQQQPEMVAGYDWEHPKTFIEDSESRQEVVATPVPPIERPKSRKIPVWAWGAVAATALAAGFAAVWLLAPKPQSPQTPQTQASVTQPVVVPPLQTGSNTNPATPQPSVLPKPSPATKSNDKPANPQEQNSTQANNTKPQVVQPPVVQPQVVQPPPPKPTPVPEPAPKPPVPQPSINDLTQQGVALYKQKSFLEASALFDKACSGGGWDACNDLGIMYRYGQGVKEDDLRAAGLYSKACDAAPPKGCNSLGEMYANNKGVSKDDTRAAALYTKACDANDAMGCSNLGNSYRDGRGVRPDDTRAATLYTKACDAKDAMGCSNLGNLYWFGRGVRPDDTRAAALYSKACDAGNAAGCSGLGICYWDGRGVGGKNPAKARELLTKGCKMGNTWGCDRLKELK